MQVSQQLNLIAKNTKILQTGKICLFVENNTQNWVEIID